VSHKFVLNTVAMSAADLSAAGLQTYDVTFDDRNYDHLPVVVDFRFVADGSPGDFNLDRMVSAQDFQIWRGKYATTPMLDADGNRDGVVDAADYVIWRKFADNGVNGEFHHAVPEPALNLLPAVFPTLAALAGSRRGSRATTVPNCKIERSKLPWTTTK
jgi:hypothetical protein